MRGYLYSQCNVKFNVRLVQLSAYISQSHNINGFSPTEKINIAGSIQKMCADVALGKRQTQINYTWSLTDFYKSRNKFYLKYPNRMKSAHENMKTVH